MQTKPPTHTPGPWLVIKPGHYGHTKHRVGRSHGKATNGDEVVAAIADICVSRSISFRGDISPEEEANARLIAAAPELLAALKAIVEQPIGHTDKDAGRDLGACCRIAREAIAKATT